MSAMASQITSLTIVYSTVYSGADQRKHQSCASLAIVRGIHRWPVNSPHKGPVTRKMFPFDNVIMQSVSLLVFSSRIPSCCPFLSSPFRSPFLSLLLSLPCSLAHCISLSPPNWVTCSLIIYIYTYLQEKTLYQYLNIIYILKAMSQIITLSITSNISDTIHKRTYVCRNMYMLHIQIRHLTSKCATRLIVFLIKWRVCQKQLSRAGTSSYTPQYLFTCPCSWYLLLTH